MSQDGRSQLIPKEIEGDGVRTVDGSCGGNWLASLSGSYVRCSLGHMHCTKCKREAHRFRKAWTCGVGCVG